MKKINKPHTIGNFVQPSLVDTWDTAKWEKHYDLLLEAGMDLMILQWTAMTPQGKFSYIGYDSPYAKAQAAPELTIRPNYLPCALEAAQKKGVKVLVGLNFADEWWPGDFRKADWRKVQVERNNAMAEEIYRLYKKQYPDALYGWYWVWEMYNDPSGDDLCWAEMMNGALDYFTKLDPTMPVLMSPFISKFLKEPPEATYQVWKSFFAHCNFRSGDIFCSQDSVGATQFPLDEIEQHIAAMKKAASVRPDVRFWINIEDFSGTEAGGAAPIERVIAQMEMASKYADELITFSYSHYYLNGTEPNEFHRQYLEYLNA